MTITAITNRDLASVSLPSENKRDIKDALNQIVTEANADIDALTSEVVNVTASTLTVAAATHANKVVTINAAAGCDVTLPAASGTGNRYKFFVGTTVTSNDITFVVTGNDTYYGHCIQLADGGSTLAAYEAAGTNRITLDGSTQGGIKGDVFQFTDVAADVWLVEAVVSATGTEATPFSTV